MAPLISVEQQLKNLVTSMTSLITASNAIPLNVSPLVSLVLVCLSLSLCVCVCMCMCGSVCMYTNVFVCIEQC